MSVLQFERIYYYYGQKRVTYVMGKTGSDVPKAIQLRNRPIWQIVLKAVVGQCTSWRDHRVNFVLMLGSSP